MKLPAIGGIIRRRILVNYRVRPEAIQSLLPPKLKPKLHAGDAIAGICLIRLEKIRLPQLPEFLGISSENAAHRVAVTWTDEQGKTVEGVYIMRRDTDSQLNHIAGGRFFPGEHHKAKFRVTDDGNRVDFAMESEDSKVAIQVRGKTADQLPKTSGFSDLEEASAFFESGSLGYSPVRKEDKLQGMRLKVRTWKVAPLQVEHVFSSVFDDRVKFPPGTISFDSALIMRDIPHEWQSEEDLYL